MNKTSDIPIRLAAFKWLEEQTSIHGEVLPRQLLELGFNYNGQRITVVGPQGIWKPKIFDIPLSITTVLKGPYRDHFTNENFLLYKYRGTDPNLSVNHGLKKAMKEQIPLIYFNNVVKGRYHAIWPVYIVNDDPKNLNFTVAADDKAFLEVKDDIVNSKLQDSIIEDTRRSYVTSQVKVRLHQTLFREKVLNAYNDQCALCRLKHRELLDAAHIIPDKDPDGEPIITNGLSLCKLHHAAFDKNIIGIKPDYTIEVRQDILEEVDGPMLKHGLQGLHEKELIIPGKRELQPDVNFLQRRYDAFINAL